MTRILAHSALNQLVNTTRPIVSAKKKEQHMQQSVTKPRRQLGAQKYKIKKRQHIHETTVTI